MLSISRYYISTLALFYKKKHQHNASRLIQCINQAKCVLNWSESYVFLNANWHLLYDYIFFKLYHSAPIRPVCEGWQHLTSKIYVWCDGKCSPPFPCLFELRLRLRLSDSGSRFISYSYISFYSTWFNTICCQLLFGALLLFAEPSDGCQYTDLSHRRSGIMLAKLFGEAFDWDTAHWVWNSVIFHITWWRPAKQFH